ncbi:MAG TPA: trypsin-like peptidase domain-containing protein, partial [Polyangiaceae bacterium]
MTLEKLIKGPRSSKIPPRLPNWGRPTQRAAAVALASALTVVGCKGHTDPASKAQQERTAIDREPTRAHPVPLPGARDPSSMADVVEKVLPSVVSISMTKASQSAFSEPLLRRFFGRALPEQRGLGSGVIVSKDGVILTNNHVVDDAREITVLTSDKRQLEAQLVGTDPKSDLAVLRVKGDASSLKPIPIGDSSRMRP